MTPSLTSAHNGPQARLTHGATLTTHLGGRLTSVTIQHENPDRPRAQIGGGRRGAIKGFSSASRRRLMRRLASINRHGSERPPAFITITYPREYPTESNVYKAHARALLKRLRRRFGARPVIWRLEFQKRGAPHFHLLVWDLEVTDELKPWLLQAWYEVCGTGDRRHLRRGVDVQRMESWKRVTVYVSKYVAKVQDGREGAAVSPGRIWGVEDSALLCITPVSWTVGWREAIRIRRTMQRYAGLRRPGGQREQGVTVFLSEDGASCLLLSVRPPPRRNGPRPLPGRVSPHRLRPSPLTSPKT